MSVPVTEDAADPYQHTFGAHHNGDWFRHQNQGILSAVWCMVCGKAAVEDHPHRAQAAGGCLEGPFCSQRCLWTWLRYPDWMDDHDTETRRRGLRQEVEG